MAALLRTLARTGLRRGLGGGPGGRGWLLIAVVATLLRIMQRKAGEPKVALSEKLEPGQSIVITHLRKGAAAT
jgi:hypothetical protein